MELMDYIYKGESLMFTFKYEAEQFAKQHKLEIVFNDGEFIDEPHYNIKGYKSKLYWIANGNREKGANAPFSTLLNPPYQKKVLHQ